MENNPGKILIIDDSNTNLVLLQAILQKHGFETITANCAKQAYLLLEEPKPSLILLDLLMPEISGFEFLETLKMNTRTADIPVIVISALTDNDNVSIIQNLGAIEYIKKPIDIQSLISSIKNILS